MYEISKKIYISDLKSVKDVLIQSVKDVLIQMCQGCSDTWHLAPKNSGAKTIFSEKELVNSHIFTKIAK